MKCRICGNTKGNKSYEVREMMFGVRETFTYFQCRKCACLQIANIPTDVSKYCSPNDYSFSPKSSATNPFDSFLRRLLALYAIEDRAIFDRILYVHPFTAQLIDELRKLSHAGVTLNSRILDVGCGTGDLLKRLGAAGFENLLGIDPYIQNDIAYESGLKLLKKTIHDIDGTWDLIMFHHSLEHILDQFETLRAVTHLLADHGTCLVRIPTVSSFAWEHYRDNWVQIDAPRHFFLHSIESLRLVALKAGLHLDKLLYDSWDFQFWGSEQYLKDIPLRCERSYAENPARSIFSPSNIVSFKRRAEEMNREGRGDQAAFYFKKSPGRTSNDRKEIPVI